MKNVKREININLEKSNILSNNEFICKSEKFL